MLYVILRAVIHSSYLWQYDLNHKCLYNLRVLTYLCSYIRAITKCSPDPLEQLSFITSTNFYFWHLDPVYICTSIMWTSPATTSKGIYI